MAKLITTADAILDYTLPETGSPVNRLRAVQDVVGGYLELLRLPGGGVAIVDEDGLLKKRPENLYASALAGRRLLGDVVVCTEEELARWDGDAES